MGVVGTSEVGGGIWEVRREVRGGKVRMLNPWPET